jgi:hypothetical protein
MASGPSAADVMSALKQCRKTASLAAHKLIGVGPGAASGGWLQSNPLAEAVNAAVDETVARAVVKPGAIALSDFVSCAEIPDRLLHEPGKPSREARVELHGVNTSRHPFDDIGTPARSVTKWTVDMICR